LVAGLAGGLLVAFAVVACHRSCGARGAVFAAFVAAFLAGPLAAAAFLAGAFFAGAFLAGAFWATDAVVVAFDARGLAAARTVSALPVSAPVSSAVALFVRVCAGMALFAAFRRALARSAMAFPHTWKTGARPDAAHSEDGKNTEPVVPRQTCHTLASRMG
jgi:hypothetical protein